MIPKFLKGLTLVSPLILLVAGCETTQFEPGNRGESTVAFSNPYSTPPAPKAFSDAEFGRDTLLDRDNLEWSLRFDGTSTVGGNTRFSYTLYKPAGSGGSHFALQDPACAVFVGGSPEPNLNNNANINLEWNPSDLVDGANAITVDFAGDVSLGVVNWGVKSSGDGSEPRTGQIIGPCQGVYTISGTVFLNDNSPDLSEPNDIQDANEPGLANVEVQLWESYDGGLTYDYDASSGIQLTSDDPDTFGDYVFEVVGPPLEGAPTDYKVVVATSATTAVGINDELFNPNIFTLACGPNCPDTADPLVAISAITKDVDLNNASGIDFGFEIDVKKAIDAFDNGFLFSSGLEREYWRVQATQRGTKKYGPEFTAEQFESLLNCSLAGYDPTPYPAEPDFQCIRDPFDVDDDFGGGVDNLIDAIYDIDGTDDTGEAADILKTDSKNDAQEGLRTQILAALLNFTVGRGICVGEVAGEGTDLTCVANAEGETLDSASMRAVIQDALVVLRNSGYGVGLSKASSGSVGDSTDLLSRVN